MQHRERGRKRRAATPIARSQYEEREEAISSTFLCARRGLSAARGQREGASRKARARTILESLPCFVRVKRGWPKEGNEKKVDRSVDRVFSFLLRSLRLQSHSSSTRVSRPTTTQQREKEERNLSLAGEKHSLSLPRTNTEPPQPTPTPLSLDSSAPHSRREARGVEKSGPNPRRRRV